MVSSLRPRHQGSTPLAELADLVGASGQPLPAVDILGVSLDSRSVLPGDLYAALPGARTHGAEYAGQAAERGAVAVLTDPQGERRVAQLGVDLPVLVHPDPRAVLGSVSAVVYGTADLALPLIGITGTNGKTTTAYLIQSALNAMGMTVGLIGTVETRIGDERVRSVRTTPEAPDLHALLATMVERGLDACVMEVSSHALAQHRVDGVVYDLALFTNLSQDHLDFHADMDDYFAAKAQLFTPVRSRRALVCVDDGWGRRLAARAEVPVETLGHEGAAGDDWVVSAAADDPAAFVLRGHGIELSLRSALPGDFNVTNTAMAAAALLLVGHPADVVSRAVATDPHVPGRMELVADPVGDPPIRAVVDYAHTPEAIHAALAALRSTTPGALVCVTGAGGDRDRDKRESMGAAAAELADVVIVTDDNPRSEDPALIRAAVRHGAEAVAQARATPVAVVEVGDRRAAIRAAVHHARASAPGATIALVGKGHESGQEIAGALLPFDDREELAAALAGEVSPR